MVPPANKPRRNEPDGPAGDVQFEGFKTAEYRLARHGF